VALVSFESVPLIKTICRLIRDIVIELQTAHSRDVHRPFSGVVSAFSCQGANGGLARYELTIQPWLWWLDLRQDSYVFTDASVLDIVDNVLSDYQAGPQGDLIRWRVEVGAAMSVRVGDYVADYADDATRAALNKELVTPIRNRTQQAVPLANKMAQFSKNFKASAGAIICLQDDLGVTMDLNAMRNTETAKLMAFIAQNQRKRFVGEVIQGFEKSFVANGQAAEWNKRFKPKYNASQIDTDRNAFKATAEPWEERINAMSDDVAAMNARASIKAIWHDFDPNDDTSAKDRQYATAACLHGATKTKAEQALWDKWFAEDVTDPYATIWGAVTAMDVGFASFMLGKQLPDVGKADKLADAAKNIREAIHQFRKSLEKRAENDALALVGLAMASQLTRLKIVNPSLYRVAGMRIMMVASVRTTVTITPTFMSMTQTQQALMLAEAAFGPPEAGLKKLLDIEATTSRRVYVVGSNGVDMYAGLQTTTEKTRAVELWLPDEVAKEIPALTGPAVLKALPPPKVNPFSGLVRFTKTLPGVFAWVGLTLQSMNLANSVKDLNDNSVSDKTDATFGIVSGTLGVLGVTAETMSGVMEHMGGRFLASTFMKVAFTGGLLATASAFAEGVQMFVKAGERNAAGDTDARNRYVGAGVMFLLSGGAALVGSLAIASTAGALTGVYGFLAPLGAAAAASVIPVAGWIAAGVILLGMGLYFLYQAIKDTDTPLEVWLLGCLYGTGSKKLSDSAEMTSLNDIMYSITIEVEWSDHAWEWRNTEFYDDYDNFRFAISLPGVGKNSVIDCTITLIGKRGRQQVFAETIRPVVVGDRVSDPHMPVMKAMPQGPVQQPSFVWWEPPRISKGGKQYGGQLKLDDDVYSSVEVAIKYWPDQVTMPNFVLPKGIDQRTLVASD
jgi:Phage tail baseplate hub (GPD)